MSLLGCCHLPEKYVFFLYLKNYFEKLKHTKIFYLFLMILSSMWLYNIQDALGGSWSCNQVVISCNMVVAVVLKRYSQGHLDPQS